MRDQKKRIMRKMNILEVKETLRSHQRKRLRNT
jgi:hypothetical protein